jgi:hypothetical protein
VWIRKIGLFILFNQVILFSFARQKKWLLWSLTPYTARDKGASVAGASGFNFTFARSAAFKHALATHIKPVVYQ